MIITFGNSEELKAYAKKQLEKTDFAVLPDVNLINKNDFVSYRDLIRIIYFNPNLGSYFPEEPEPIWGNSISITNSTQPKTDIPTE